MALPKSDRPDGIILADDNFLPAAVQGLIDADIGVPDDVSVVALTNFPNIVSTPVPVTRLGFDAGRILDLLTDRLDQGHKGDETLNVYARFESE